MKKRILIVLLAGVMLVTAGCSGNEEALDVMGSVGDEVIIPIEEEPTEPEEDNVVIEEEPEEVTEPEEPNEPDEVVVDDVLEETVELSIVSEPTPISTPEPAPVVTTTPTTPQTPPVQTTPTPTSTTTPPVQQSCWCRNPNDPELDHFTHGCGLNDYGEEQLMIRNAEKMLQSRADMLTIHAPNCPPTSHGRETTYTCPITGKSVQTWVCMCGNIVG